jgi:hypothetical protein
VDVPKGKAEGDFVEIIGTLQLGNGFAGRRFRARTDLVLCPKQAAAAEKRPSLPGG